MALLAPPKVLAQDSLQLTSDTPFRKTAGGTTLGTARAGDRFRIRRTDGDWVEVRLEGWIFSQSLARTDREGFDLMVSPQPENFRDAPNGQLLARLEAGALLKRVSEQAGWTRARRDVWVPRSALGPVAARSGPAGRDTTRTGPCRRPMRSPATSGTAVETAGPTRIFTAPDADTLGILSTGARARILSQSGEWVRVQIEGWVRQADVRPAADSGVLAGVTAAEVRAAPSRYIGRTVEWRVQFLSLQRADELRPEIPEGRPYLLTRGPLPEVGFVYVIVPADQADRFQSLTPLQEMTLRVVIRSASTRYLPNPVVELVEVVSP